MDTKCKAKINKLGEMINDLLMKVIENKELYGDVYKLREKHDAICSLIKKDKSVSSRQAKYFMARAFKTKQWENELNQDQKNLIEQSFKNQMIELKYL